MCPASLLSRQLNERATNRVASAEMPGRSLSLATWLEHAEHTEEELRRRRQAGGSSCVGSIQMEQSDHVPGRSTVNTVIENAAGGRQAHVGCGRRLKLTWQANYVRGHLEGTTSSALNRAAEPPASSRCVWSRLTYEMCWHSRLPADRQALPTPLRSLLDLDLGQRTTAAPPIWRQGQPVSSAQAQSERGSGRRLEHAVRGPAPRTASISSHVDAEGFRIIRPGTRRPREHTGRRFSWSRQGDASVATCPPGSSTSVNQP